MCCRRGWCQPTQCFGPAQAAAAAAAAGTAAAGQEGNGVRDGSAGISGGEAQAFEIDNMW